MRRFISQFIVVTMLLSPAMWAQQSAPASTQDGSQMKQEIDQLKKQLAAMEERLAAQEKAAQDKDAQQKAEEIGRASCRERV